MKQPLLIIAALTLLVSACGNEDTAQTTSAPAAPQAPAATPAPAPTSAPAPAAASSPPVVEKSAAPRPGAPAPAPAQEPAKTAPAVASGGNVPSLEEGTALAKKSGCFACHDKEFKRQIIGPAWGAVAEKYRGTPDAHDIVVKWVHTGGAGRWGTAVMPPYSPRVPDDEIEKLVSFILSLPKP